jgi:hypothetical protein
VTLEGLLRQLAQALDASGIPFMLTGSIAAAYHGAARATMDVDAVIDPTPAQLEALLSRLEAEGLYVSREAARTALAEHGMFNVIDAESGWKADLIMRKHRPFSDEEFARKAPAELLGERVAVATIEDVILSKLEWASIGGSARQLEDVRRLLAIGGDAVDRRYIDRWIAPLGLQRVWQSVIDETAP